MKLDEVKNSGIKKGKLIGASLGPGDPQLITRKAWNALHSGAQWAYPIRKKGSDSYALGIAQRAELITPTDALALIFPMTHDAEKLARYWLEAAHTVLQVLNTGRDVVFLVEGDASTFSTFSHLARTLRGVTEDVVIDTIPGVPAYNAACATLAQPLSDVDDTIAIVPAAYGVAFVENLLIDFDTLVLMKVKPLLDDIIDLLERKQLLAHTAFIEKVGADEERIVRDITQLRGTKVNYLSLMLVKNPARQRGEIQKGCRKKTA